MAMNGATQGELWKSSVIRSPTMTRRYAHFSKEHIARILQKTSNNLIGPSGVAHDDLFARRAYAIASSP